MTTHGLERKISNRIRLICNEVGCHECKLNKTPECVADLQEELISMELDGNNK